MRYVQGLVGGEEDEIRAVLPQVVSNDLVAALRLNSIEAVQTREVISFDDVILAIELDGAAEEVAEGVARNHAVRRGRDARAQHNVNSRKGIIPIAGVDNTPNIRDRLRLERAAGIVREPKGMSRDGLDTPGGRAYEVTG